MSLRCDSAAWGCVNIDNLNWTGSALDCLLVFVNWLHWHQLQFTVRTSFMLDQRPTKGKREDILTTWVKVLYVIWVNFIPKFFQQHATFVGVQTTQESINSSLTLQPCKMPKVNYWVPRKDSCVNNTNRRPRRGRWTRTEQISTFLVVSLSADSGLGVLQKQLWRQGREQGWQRFQM